MVEICVNQEKNIHSANATLGSVAVKLLDLRSEVVGLTHGRVAIKCKISK